MAAQTWTTLKAMLLATMVRSQAPFTSSDGFFDTLYPQAISYAEGRIYRDVDLLDQRQQNASLSTTAGSRTVSLSAIAGANGYGPLVSVEAFALITPSGAPAAGTRVPFDVASLDTINQVWPVESAVLAPSIADFSPRFWAMVDDATIIYCPTADATYTVEITGLFQSAPLTSANPTSYLSTVYPDLLEAACMVFLSGALMHNFGAQSNDPKSSLSWEGMYQSLLSGVRAEERRRRGLAPDRPPAAAPGAPA